MYKHKASNVVYGLQYSEKDTASELTMLIFYTAIAGVMIAALWVALQSGVYVTEPAQQFRGF